jgi:putative ABC transport system substrate-binding protein
MRCGITSNMCRGILPTSSARHRLAAGKIAQFGREYRLPVIAAWREFVDAGRLVSYGPSRKFEAKRIAGYVEKILAGEKPEDLPIETPTKFELIINPTSAVCTTRSAS